MPEFRGRYRFRRVDKPKGDAALDFSCGTDRYADEVNKLLRNQFIGKAVYHPVHWILEDITARNPKPIGACAWRLWASPVAPQRKPLDEVYVHLIGLAKDYRKRWLPAPDGRSLGHLLLAESLKQIKIDWSPQPMPVVWASVSPQNSKSANMFGAYGFTRYFPVPGWGEAVLWRPPNMGI